MRGRHKDRGYHQCGWKQDMKRRSEWMCPYCYSFGCDPMSMSPVFQHKISERLRKGLCPMCGQPKEHCKCKSSEKIAPGTHTIRTHNNKKRRAALAHIKAVEHALLVWTHTADQWDGVADEAMVNAMDEALYRHKVPTIAWSAVVALAQKAGLGQDFLAAMYPVWH